MGGRRGRHRWRPGGAAQRPLAWRAPARIAAGHRHVGQRRLGGGSSARARYQRRQRGAGSAAAARRARSHRAFASRDRSCAPQATTTTASTSTVRLSVSGGPAANSWISGGAPCGSDHGRRQAGADVGLIGGNVIAAGDDGTHVLRVERGCADAQPAVADGERDLRRGDRNAPADKAGSTSCRSRLSSVTWPPSLARIAISKARGLSPGIRPRPASPCRCRRARRSAPRRCGPGSSASSASTPVPRHREVAVAQRAPHRRRSIEPRIQRHAVGAMARVEAGAVVSPPPTPPLIASSVSDWPSLLTSPLTGRNSLPPGNVPRSAWKATRPRQPFEQPRAQRLGGIVSGSADRQRKGRREIEWSRPSSPSTFFSPSAPSVTAR